MTNKSLFSFLITTIIALTLIAPSISAFATIQEIVVNGVELDAPFPDATISTFSGDTLSIRVTFYATQSDEEAFVTARILGESGTLVETSEFAVLENGTYSRLLHINLPSDLDDDVDEPLTLEVIVEGKTKGIGDEAHVDLHIQRENDFLEIIAIESDDTVKAGGTLAIDVVAHNNGRHEADNTFVKASISALGISKMVFIGDLSAFDQGGNVADKEDSALGRIFLTIPKDAPAGVYNIEIEVFNADSSVIASRKVVVVGSSVDSTVISSSNSKSFGKNTPQTYTVTIVNADDTIKVFELVLEAANGLTVNLEENLVAVPAGTSKTVTLTAMAVDEGTYNFAVNVHSGGELVSRQSYIANVRDDGSKSASTGSAAVVLTIILVIIFVVLLIVLIVLLTRKTEKTNENFGESYY